jgi:cell division initiation protein
MELTPLDIKNQTFQKKTFGGYDPEEVHSFLFQVAADYERRVRLQHEANEKLKITEERVNYYKLIEKTLQDSVVTMQKTLDDSRANAQKEAELVVAEAKARAERIGEDIRVEHEQLLLEIRQLKELRQNYFIRFKSMIHAQEELLEAMMRDEVDADDDGNHFRR